MTTPIPTPACHPNRVSCALLALTCLGLGWLAPARAETPSAAPATAEAATAQKPQEPPSAPIGAATHALFEHQRQASAQRRAPGIPGPIAVESWDRYLRSYKSEIPEQFDRQLKSTGSK